MTRTVLRLTGALVLAALVVGPSAEARAPQHHARPAFGHTTNEWLMMGPRCGAGLTPG